MTSKAVEFYSGSETNAPGRLLCAEALSGPSGQKHDDGDGQGLAGVPALVPADPHPSWRTTGWLKKNPWFEAEVVSEMRQRVRRLV